MHFLNRTESHNFALQKQHHEVNFNIVRVNTHIMSTGAFLNNQLIRVVEIDLVKFLSLNSC